MLLGNAQVVEALDTIEDCDIKGKDMHLFNIGSLDMVNKRIKKVDRKSVV